MNQVIVTYNTHFLATLLGLPTLAGLAILIYAFWPARRPDPNLVSEGWRHDHAYRVGKQGDVL